MDNLYNYFRKFSDKVYFLTVKNIEINEKNYENIDFPISSNVLLENIKNNKFNENINLSYFFEGILLLNGIDSNFENIEFLNGFIKSKNINLLDFVKSKIDFNDNNYDTIIYNLLIIRGLINLEISLEISDDFIIKIYTKYLLMILDYDNSYYNMLINEIKILLSDLESKNEDDYLLNMLYGDLCVKEKFYIKANIFYKKAITNSNKIIDNIINKKIQDITVKVKIEELLQLVDRFNFEDCYKILESIDNFSLDKEDSYWIGYVYNKLNENEKSIEYYEKSLDLNADFLNIFIELGLLYYKIQKIEKSLEIFERGLSIYIDDEKLLFNKIILELKLKRFKKAKEDIEKLLLYEDIDNSIMNDILYLQELYKNELK